MCGCNATRCCRRLSCLLVVRRMSMGDRHGRLNQKKTKAKDPTLCTCVMATKATDQRLPPYDQIEPPTRLYCSSEEAKLIRSTGGWSVGTQTYVTGEGSRGSGRRRGCGTSTDARRRRAGAGGPSSRPRRGEAGHADDGEEEEDVRLAGVPARGSYCLGSTPRQRSGTPPCGHYRATKSRSSSRSRTADSNT
jgi:hypothetical protein